MSAEQRDTRQTALKWRNKTIGQLPPLGVHRAMLSMMTIAMMTGTSIVASSHKRNILLIVCDDLRPALQSYGDVRAKTPHIDRLAAESVVFTHAYAQQALCAPSRNSMLTSRRPDTLRLYDFYSYWRIAVGNFSTLPQHLKSHGYETRSFGKIFHPGASSNHTDDFPYSWSQPPYHSPVERFMNQPLCPDARTGRAERNLICPVDVHFQPGRTLPDQDNVRAAVEFLRTRTPNGADDDGDDDDRRRPWFVAVGLHKPHIPLRFPARYLDRHQPVQRFAEPDIGPYVPHDMPSVAFNPYVDVRSRADVRQQNVSFPFGPMPSAFAMRLRQAYYAAVSYADDLVGELLREVDDTSRTVVMLTSDHGWSLGEHAEWAKYSNFEVSVRVPLIVRNGGGCGGRRIDRIVELLEVFPTLVELAGVPALPQCTTGAADELSCNEGRSLVPWIKMAATNDGIERVTKPTGIGYSQYPRPAAYPQMNSDRPRLAQIRTMGYTMRTDQYRYTVWVAFDPSTFRRNWSQIAGEELYDHRLDVGESCNLAGREQLSSVRRMLRRRLRRKFP